MTNLTKIKIIIISTISGIGLGSAWHWGFEGFVVGILGIELFVCFSILLEQSK